MQGWISLHRRIKDHWVWADKPFSKGQAWIDILMMVNHEDKKILLGSELVEVKRGSRVTSIRQLCDRWGWSNTKTKNFLELLEKDKMLVVKSDTKKTTLTVVNYNDYQVVDDSKNDTETTRERHEGDTETTRKHTNNNDNNDNNENKDIYTKVQKNKNPKKNKYSEYVSMTEEEYQKLLDKHGEELTKKMIEALDNYKGSNGKKYKSDYRAILNWVEGKVLKEVNYKPSTVNKRNRFHTQEQRTDKYTPAQLEAIARKRREQGG